ncbi:putative inorganic pyrophosphatase [Leishmania mexicana MHOM/GT/2001/U1103]|uniref:inorganic diphosphatase n=1 Tax=Leishmania mexicana (strain MHOM/GT/2001/U1103) TaxID=929439 RepID=E9AJX5_LEIMU|nr:putative inorganic pyrophosphatase [Leishmania mexicana MHOM/GT/2001/U1103]CBZ23225.1 putative inorganic pyrophosphatase [Leishmania mexicana MHOM/GT/2001/U1103]
MLSRALRLLSSKSAASVVALPVYNTTEEGPAGSKAWRVFYKNAATDAIVSAWHDLPLYTGASAEPLVLTCVTEIPKGTRAKLELSKEEPHNPIKQDILKSKEGQPLRYFLYGDMPFNYGFLPCTWEDPTHIDPNTKCVGDGDPVDVVHIGTPHRVGTYGPVRVLGVLGLIDEGETDWKIIVESVSTTAGEGYGMLSKVPQELQATIIDWFENYKVPDGKKKNEFAFNKAIKDAETALSIVAQCASQYNALMEGKCTNPGYWLR